MKITLIILLTVVGLAGCNDQDTSRKADADGSGTTVEEPLIEEPLSEEPLTEEPLTEEPLTEEPLIEEPLIEEPLIDEPLIDEPLIEEPNGGSEDVLSAALSWHAPTTRVNGDTLHLYEIEHYLITRYYDGVEYTVEVSYDTMDYDYYNLPSGEHSFDIITVDIDGLRSTRSARVFKVIP